MLPLRSAFTARTRRGSIRARSAGCGTTALAMGGSNQSLFLLGALLLAQGSAAIPLLIVGLLLSYAPRCPAGSSCC